MNTTAEPQIRQSNVSFAPELSLVMPCYNEEACLAETAPALIDAFTDEGIRLELVLVDNGSRDRTGAIINDLMRRGLSITKVSIASNRGYGAGIRAGLAACRAPVIGYLCADGQVAPEDVVRTYRLMEGREERVLAKVRRRFRQDSLKRKLVSITYNALMLVAYGGLGAIDLNGSPKLFSRKHYERMQLKSDDWFLDPEIMIKTKALGLRVMEIDVEGYMRHGGVSNVRPQTIFEFLRNIWRYRFGAALKPWRTHIETEREKGNGGPASLVPSAIPATGWRRAIRQAGVTGVRVIRQNRHEDPRGFLQKVLTTSQCDGHPPRGEVYVTSAKPGEAKGNHYHQRMGEWFAVVQGTGVLELCDPTTGARISVPLSSSEPSSVYVPAGLAHAVVNTGRNELICVAWAEAEHDASDVHPFPVCAPIMSTEANTPERVALPM
jgi:glycosyltransferase involved in cell wall biosynthesis